MGVQSLQPPLVALLPLRNNSLTDTPSSLSAHLSSLPSIPIVLPNDLLPLPIWSTPESLFDFESWIAKTIVNATATFEVSLSTLEGTGETTTLAEGGTSTFLSTSTSTLPFSLPTQAHGPLAPSAFYTPPPFTSPSSSAFLLRPSGAPPLPTRGPVNASVVAGLAEARSSLAAEASKGFVSSGGERRRVGRAKEGWGGLMGGAVMGGLVGLVLV